MSLFRCEHMASVCSLEIAYYGRHKDHLIFATPDSRARFATFRAGPAICAPRPFGAAAPEVERSAISGTEQAAARPLCRALRAHLYKSLGVRASQVQWLAIFRAKTEDIMQLDGAQRTTMHIRTRFSGQWIYGL